MPLLYRDKDAVYEEIVKVVDDSGGEGNEVVIIANQSIEHVDEPVKQGVDRSDMRASGWCITGNENGSEVVRSSIPVRKGT